MSRASQNARRQPMTIDQAEAELAWLDTRGVVYSACSGPPGWYQAIWFEPTLGREWRSACNIEFGYDRALAVLIKARVEADSQ